MKIVLWIMLVPLLAAVLVIVAGQFGLLTGSPPSLGVGDGRLKPPSATPNSVSSQTGLYPDHPQKNDAAIAPFAFQGDGKAALGRLAAQLQSKPGCTLVSQSPDYLYATCRTKLLKFTDDLEFWLDPVAGVIQIRSSSRLGRKDFGVNRARMEAIRSSFTAGVATPGPVSASAQPSQ